MGDPTADWQTQFTTFFASSGMPIPWVNDAGYHKPADLYHIAIHAGYHGGSLPDDYWGHFDRGWDNLSGGQAIEVVQALIVYLTRLNAGETRFGQHRCNQERIRILTDFKQQILDYIHSP